MGELNANEFRGCRKRLRRPSYCKAGCQDGCQDGCSSDLLGHGDRPKFECSRCGTNDVGSRRWQVEEVGWLVVYESKHPNR